MNPPSESSIKSAQQLIWDRWAETLKNDPTPENYARAYNEVNAFLRDHGDPALERSADGTVFGYTGAEDDWQKRIIIALAGEPGKRILELGCGDGRMAVALARRGALVKGIDISDVAISLARKLAAKEKLAIQFEVANAILLDEPSASYDLATSSDMVEHLNPAQVAQHLKEVFRVLKPGGVYIVSLPAWMPEGKVDPLHLGNHRPAEFQALLREAGFSPRLAPEVMFERTGDLTAIIGPPKTPKAKLARVLAAIPLLARIIQQKLIYRWCGGLNFYWAAKLTQ